MAAYVIIQVEDLDEAEMIANRLTRGQSITLRQDYGFIYQAIQAYTTVLNIIHELDNTILVLPGDDIII